ncbi:hypothetical protein LCGC14_1066240 [marine sediment metagenome]|uniref:Cyclophilin-like domain-containing protein n=2 Tax=root TaxID=1 RepID=A0A831QNC9_9FLAO|nr:hypothetical protein [Pricia sp.]HEA21879.1 hypothetical protein [Pricia antarctica]
MKSLILIFFVYITVFIVGTSFRTANEPIITEHNCTMAIETIKITIDSKTFTATLLNNATTKAFKELLPLTIRMTELNGNEKYYDFPESLPTNSSNIDVIQKGDIMLYRSNTLVLFYDNFSTSYAYTKIGKINDPTGLAEALGTGNVSIRFENM